jgi:hypothetical protein
MLLVIVAVLALAGLLLIIAHLRGGLWRKYRYQQSVQATSPLALSHPAGRHLTVLLHVQDGVMIREVRPVPQQPPLILPASWYKRLRTIVSLGFLLMVLLALFVQSGLADGTLKNLSRSFSLLADSQLNTADVHAVAHSAQMQNNAAQQLARISQLDPNQYDSSAEYNTWAYSACSTASLTEVFNAYGRHFRITDVLKVEARIGAITPALGLLDPSGIQTTAAQFGFKTTWSNAWTLDQIMAIANSGKPVIVSFPPDRYDGGHLLVVTGGNDTMVYLADSSLWNRRAIPRWQFLQWWAGFGAVVTPQ